MPQDPRMDARITRRLLRKKQQLDTYRPLEQFTVQRLHQDLRLLARKNRDFVGFSWSERIVSSIRQGQAQGPCSSAHPPPVPTGLSRPSTMRARAASWTALSDSKKPRACSK
jgi:hypothetical protein